jgi:hypothetical protein
MIDFTTRAWHWAGTDGEGVHFLGNGLSIDYDDSMAQKSVFRWDAHHFLRGCFSAVESPAMAATRNVSFPVHE